MDWSTALLILILAFILWVFYEGTRPRPVYTLQHAREPEMVYPEGNPHVFRDSVGCAVVFVSPEATAQYGNNYCPWCKSEEPYGHAPDCPRQIALGLEP